jgi:hypothetical protein
LTVTTRKIAARVIGAGIGCGTVDKAPPAAGAVIGSGSIGSFLRCAESAASEMLRAPQCGKCETMVKGLIASKCR